MPLLKPPQWTWNRHDLSPEAEPFTRGLTFAVPFFKVGTATGTQEVIQRAVGTTTEDAEIVVTDIGAALWGRPRPGNLRKYAVSFPLTYPTGDFSWSIVIKRLGTIAINARVISNSDGSFRLANSGGSDIRWYALLDGSLRQMNIGTIASIDTWWPVGQWVIISGTHRQGQQYGEARWIGADTPASSNSARTYTGVYMGVADIDIGGNTVNAAGFPSHIGAFYMWDRWRSIDELAAFARDPYMLLRPALLETVTVVGDDRSGSGTIVETHTVVGEGRKDASDTGAISHGHTVVGQGDKAASNTAAISHGHTTIGEGTKAGTGTGDISRGHTVVAVGIKKASDTGSVSHGHTVEAAGVKAASNIGSISHPYTVVGQGDKAVSGTGSISHGHTVVATGVSSEAADFWTVDPIAQAADPVAYTPAPVAHTRLVPDGPPWSE